MFNGGGQGRPGVVDSADIPDDTARMAGTEAPGATNTGCGDKPFGEDDQPSRRRMGPGKERR